MKLLFDNNLSRRLVQRLADLYPGSVHVATAGLANAQDSEIWHYARLNGLLIVTKDSDFAELSLFRGAPPKIILLQVGNCTTVQVEMILRRNNLLLQLFNEDEGSGIVTLTDI